jgi:hypothetical protein
MMKEMSNDRRNGGRVWSLVHRTARSTAFKVDYAMIGIICLRIAQLSARTHAVVLGKRNIQSYRMRTNP